MKKVLISILAATAAIALLAGCGMAGMTTADKVVDAEAVQRKLAEKDYKILVRFMIPTGAASRPVNYEYSVKVSGDTLVSYLPYFGRAYNLPYGGGKGLDFTAKISEYQDVPAANGGHDIYIKLSNDEDVFLYTISVSAGGDAFMSVNSRNRDKISYSGEMELP